MQPMNYTMILPCAPAMQRSIIPLMYSLTHLPILTYNTIHISPVIHRRVPQGRLNPNPAIQLLYLSIVVAQSFCGYFALLKSIHSSRVAFSSLHTQHGLGFETSVEVLRSAPRFALVAVGIEIDLEAILCEMSPC